MSKWNPTNSRIYYEIGAERGVAADAGMPPHLFPVALGAARLHCAFAMKPRPRVEDYDEHVEHPRYGKSPRFTGLDPNPNAPTVHLHWNTRYFTQAQLREMERLLGLRPTFPDDGTRMVRGTAVAADPSRQTPATVPVTQSEPDGAANEQGPFRCDPIVGLP